MNTNTEQVEMDFSENDDTQAPGEMKGDRFKRVATRRLRSTMKELQLLANTANTANYFYTDEQVEKIIKNIDDSVAKLKQAFAGKAKDEDDLPTL